MLKLLCNPVDSDFIKYKIMDDYNKNDEKLFYLTGDPFVTNVNWIGNTTPNQNSTIIPYEYIGYEGKDESEISVGYFSYNLNIFLNSITNIQIYSFKTSYNFINDVFNKIDELIKLHHSVTWACIQGNKLEKAYDNFLKKYEKDFIVNKVINFHITKDKEGNYRNGITYEIINKNK